MKTLEVSSSYENENHTVENMESSDGVDECDQDVSAIDKSVNSAGSRDNTDEFEKTHDDVMSDDEEEDEDEEENSQNNSNNATDMSPVRNIIDDQKRKAEPIHVDQGDNTKATAAKPLPLTLKGTLSYNEHAKKHILRGMWNEASSGFPPQPFELKRNLQSDEDPTALPKDGEFHGSFSLAYIHTSSKGKQKERKRVISESGVKITFKKIEGKEEMYEVNGKGTNQFGVFTINGTAIRDAYEKDRKFLVELQKRYEVVAPPPESSEKKEKNKKRKLPTAAENGDDSVTIPQDENAPLPPPSESFPENVYCLRGKLERDSTDLSSVAHKVSGLWSSGLNLIKADPDNLRGLCNRFEYEHRCSVSNQTFPVSGRYSGWFNLSLEDGSRTRITEKDVTLKFIKNNAGYYNVEGKGSNAFGKYSISGSLDKDNILTIFRHFFQPKKAKKSTTPPTETMVSPHQTNGSGTDTIIVQNSQGLTLDDVEVPEKESHEPLIAPADGQYSAISRGVFRVNDDGSCTCSGKWAITRNHHNSNLASHFHFGLESHHAALAAEEMKKNRNLKGVDKSGIFFPLDSANYKGSFKMKRGTAKLQSVIDKQIVLKFRQNTDGAYNVYGKGTNSIGTYDLVGTLILQGRGSGHVELFRMYPIQAPEQQQAPEAISVSSQIQNNTSSQKMIPSKTASSSFPNDADVDLSNRDMILPTNSSSYSLLSTPLLRRESSRQIKLPSRLEDGDPQAHKMRMLEKCSSILKFIADKDASGGSFFLEPVDPVAHGIPTYHQIISDPMDLGTIQTKLNNIEIASPEEFANLVRLVFENAMRFNVDPDHVVHQAARNLLILFNQKYRDVERLFEKKKATKAEQKELRRKQKLEDKKREREVKSKKSNDALPDDPLRMKLEQSQTASQSVSKILDSITSSLSNQKSSNGAREEFNIIFDAIKHLHVQISCVQDVIEKLVTSDIISTRITDTMHESKQGSLQSLSSIETGTEKKTKKKKKSKTIDMKEEDIPYILPSLPVPVQTVASVPIDQIPLTLEEQQQLTEAINGISEEKLHTIIEIIRESADLNEDEDEIDLEIDQLDTATQRKLQSFVIKNQPKPKRQKKPQKKKAEAQPKPTSSLESRLPQTKAQSSAATESFFGFGGKGDDSDSDDVKGKDNGARQHGNMNAGSSFKICENHSTNPMLCDDDEAMDIDGISITANWDMSIPTSQQTGDNESVDEDDAWEAARGAVAAQQALDKERLAREEKIRAEAEAAQNKQLAEAAARGKKLQEERKIKEAEEARQRDLKEKEEKERAQKAREHALQNLQAIEQTVHLDDQRELMKEYEQSFYDKDLGGGASPSSDFGF